MNKDLEDDDNDVDSDEKEEDEESETESEESELSTTEGPAFKQEIKQEQRPVVKIINPTQKQPQNNTKVKSKSCIIL